MRTGELRRRSAPGSAGRARRFLATTTALLLLVAGSSTAAQPGGSPAPGLRELKPLVHLSPAAPAGGAWAPRAALAGGALAALLGWAAARRRAARRDPAARVALGVLAGLSAGPELSAGAFYRELSSTLARYLEGRFSIPAGTRSAEELRALFAQLSPGAEERARLEELVSSAEAVKYGRASVTTARRAVHLEAAISFVQRTSGGSPRASA